MCVGEDSDAISGMASLQSLLFVNISMNMTDNSFCGMADMIAMYGRSRAEYEQYVHLVTPLDI